MRGLEIKNPTDREIDSVKKDGKKGVFDFFEMSSLGKREVEK